MSDELLSALQTWADNTLRQSMLSFRRYNQEQNLSFSQVNALIYISREQPVTLGSLVHHLGFTPAAISQLVDRLVEQGLVSRVEDPRDRRSKLLSLTESGTALITEGRRARHRWLIEFSQDLPREDQDGLIHCLTKLNQHFTKFIESQSEQEGPQP